MRSILKRHHVRVHGGQNEKIIVLGHGFGTDRSVWHELEPLLVRRGYKVISYNLVYAGTNRDSFNLSSQRLSTIVNRLHRSTSLVRKRPSCYGCRARRDFFDFQRYSKLDAYAEDLLDILDALGIKRCLFLGHSVSGMIGLLASAKRPGLFERILLLATSPCYLDDPTTDYNGGFSEEGLSQIFRQMETHYGDWVKGFAPAAIAETNNKAIREFTEGLMRIRPDIAVATCKLIFRLDFRSILPLIDPPCDILQSRQDVAVPTSVAEYLRDHIRLSTLHMLPTSGHLPHLSSSIIVNAAILRIIAGSGDSRGRQGGSRTCGSPTSLQAGTRLTDPLGEPGTRGSS